MGAGASSESDNDSIVRITSSAAIEKESDSEALRKLHEAVESEVTTLRKFTATRDAEFIYNTVSEKKSDKVMMIRTLLNRTPAQLHRIDQLYQEKYGKTLDAVLAEDIEGPLGLLLKFFFMQKVPLFVKYLNMALEKKVKVDVLTDIASFCTNAELSEVVSIFESENGPIENILKKRLSGEVLGAMLAIYKGEKDDSSTVDEELAAEQAEKLFKAGVGKAFGTEEIVFYEILSKSSRAQIQAINAAYKAAHKHDLAKAIKDEFTKDAKQALQSLLQPSIEASIAFSLSKAFEGFGCDEERIALIIACMKHSNIQSVCELYESTYGLSLDDVLNDELKGDLRFAAVSSLNTTEPSQGMESKNTNRSLDSDDEIRVATLDLAKERSILLDFVALTDAMAIERACFGSGTRDKDLIAILCARSRSHLKRVNAYYEQLFGKSLLAEVQVETKGFYRQLMCFGLMPFDEVDATVCKQALDSKNGKLFLAEVIAALSNRRIAGMKAKYSELYGEDISTRVEREFCGVELDLVKSLLIGQRNESDEIDMNLAASQASRLKATADGVPQTESTFIEVVTHVSFAQLRCISDQFMNQYEKSLEDALRGDCSDPLRVALASTVSDPISIYASSLKRTFQGKKTNDSEVTRIFGSNDKIKISQISKRYEEMFGETLIDALKANVTGTFQLACITYVASADPILPDELRAVTDHLTIDDEEERFPSEEEEYEPQGKPANLERLKHSHFVRAVSNTPVEDVDEDEEHVLSDCEEGSNHSSDNPGSDEEWEMTPELKTLFDARRKAAANKNRIKVRMISRKIKSIINQQLAEKHGD